MSELAKSPKITNLGRYLYSLRIQRGFAQVSEYLREYDLPISDVYYRDIESGKKHISLDTAYEFCMAIKADKKPFFFHLLTDILPEDIIALLLRPVADDTFSSLEERQILLERDKHIYREALAKAKLEDSHVLSSEAVDMLVEEPHLMPVLHFLYAMDSVKAKELSEVLSRNHIDDTIDSVVARFVDVGLAVTSGNWDNETWRIRRRSITSRTPLTPMGRRLKYGFALREVEKCLYQPRTDFRWTETGAFIDTSIIELSDEGVQLLRSRIFDVLAEAASSVESIAKGTAMPYFLGVFFGSRYEYSALDLPGEVDQTDKE